MSFSQNSAVQDVHGNPYHFICLSSCRNSYQNLHSVHEEEKHVESGTKLGSEASLNPMHAAVGNPRGNLFPMIIQERSNDVQPLFQYAHVCCACSTPMVTDVQRNGIIFSSKSEESLQRPVSNKNFLYKPLKASGAGFVRFP